MNKNKIVFYSSTGLLSLMMVGSAGTLFFNHTEAVQTFTRLGFPTYVIYPLGIAKLLGLAAIWTSFSRILKEWAYAGFFFNFILALSAHFFARDGEYAFAATAIALLAISYFTDKKARR